MLGVSVSEIKLLCACNTSLLQISLRLEVSEGNDGFLFTERSISRIEHKKQFDVLFPIRSVLLSFATIEQMVEGLNNLPTTGFGVWKPAVLIRERMKKIPIKTRRLVIC